MKYLIYILSIVFLLSVGCKKDGTEPIYAPTKTDSLVVPDPVDTLVGVYIGIVEKRSETRSTPPGKQTVMIYDTTYYLDTIVITKASVDSIKLDDKQWTVLHENTIFKYNNDQKYTVGYGASGVMNQITLTFDLAKDSLYVLHHAFAGPYGDYVKTDRQFTGKKQ